MKTARVCFLWHMHQPYYTDPVTGSASMPWVRLHAAKAYFDMAHVLERFPSVQATFNFTPSLLLQLQEIGSGTVRDLFDEHAQQPADQLQPEQKAFIVRHFFSANWATMVRPFPRYHELLVKRGLEVFGQELERVARQFTTQELLDLQVWFNLAWFGYGMVRKFPQLAALRKKNRGFTEEDKQEVLALQRTAVQEIIPLYRRLAERGQIELTTTPFFHPILPLVIDTDHTRRARPDLPLPVRFRAPEDAEAQLKRAVEFHTAAFGRPPVGLWPSEGSVCPELIPMLSPLGLQWLATDEGILTRSLQEAHQPWNRQNDLYRPYRVGPESREVSIIFRDRELSDAFGFLYHKTTPDNAADDVLRRIRTIAHETTQEEVLIPIVLDGENPWEHYHEGGEQFLSRLYEAFANGALNEGETLRVASSTMGQALAAMPPGPTLSHLHSGSWINQDYKIWIGHHEDNRGWDLVGQTRSKLLELTPTLPPDRAQAAWNELYAAEGSDWYWWYGDDFETAYKDEFDRLFRTHLRNVWTLAGAVPPDSLNQPICGVRLTPDGRSRVTQPVMLVSPTLDGMVTDFFEWRGAGAIDPHPPLGAMWKADGLFTAIHFGWSFEHLFFRFDPDERSETRRQQMRLELHVQTAAASFRISAPLTPSEATTYQLERLTTSGSWETLGQPRLLGFRQILELAIPLKEIGLEAGQEVRLTVVVQHNGLEAARYPHDQPALLTAPGPEFEATVWRV